MQNDEATLAIENETESILEAAPTTGAGSGDDVMQILAGVERQFDQLRQIQTDHAREVESLAERSQRLDAAQAELDERAESLDAAEASLHRRAEELDARIGTHEEAHREREIAIDALESELAERRAELDTLRSSLDAERAELEDAQAALAQDRSEVESREQAVGDHETQLAEARVEAERLQAAIAERDARLEASESQQRETGAERDQLDQAVTELRGQLETSAARIDALETELEEARRAAEATERDALNMVQEAETQRDVLQAQLGERVESIGQLEAAVREREATIEGLRAHCDDANKKLEHAGAKLLQFSQLLQQAPGLPAGAAPTAELIEKQKQIDELTAALDAARRQASSDPGAAADGPDAARVAELEAELEQARALVQETIEGSAEAAAALEAGQRELTVEKDRLVSRLDHALAEVEQLQQRLSSVEAESTSSEELDDLKERNRMLTERVETLDHAVAAAQAEVEAARALAGEGIDDDGRFAALTGERDELATRVRELESNLEAARSASSGASDQAEGLALRAEARRLAELGETLKERDKALKALEQKISDDRSRAKATMDRAPIVEEEVRDLRVQQGRLQEHRKMLAEAERQMIRRWSRPRSMTLVGWLLVMLAVTASGSWMAASHFFPPRVAATVTVTTTDPNAPAESLALWQHWHETRLYDTQFHAEIAERMGDRLIEPMRSPSAVSRLIVDDLAVDNAHPGELTLSLARPDAAEAVVLLDMLASSLADTARLQQGEREDGLMTTIRGGKDGSFATLSPMPIQDERLLYGGGIFGASLVASLMLAGIVSTLLGRSKPILIGEELSALEVSYCEASPTDTQSLKPL